MVPQLANIATVDSLQSKANWAPLSMGPQVFQTDDMPSHRIAPGYTSVLYKRATQANLLFFPQFQSPVLKNAHKLAHFLNKEVGALLCTDDMP